MSTPPVLVSIVTGEERYGLVNKAYQDWFGVSQEQLLGRSIRDFIGEAAYEKLGPFVKRGLSGERLSFEQNGVPYRYGGNREFESSSSHDAIETACKTATLRFSPMSRRSARWSAIANRLIFTAPRSSSVKRSSSSN